MKKKTITIDNEIFELKVGNYNDVIRLDYYAYRTLYDCYNNPSSIKKAIYDEWRKWAYDNDVEKFGVSSYNCHFFTLQGLIKIDSRYFIIRITPSHNYLIQV